MYKNFLFLNLIVLISVGFFSSAKNYVPEVESSSEVETQESLNLGFKELSKKVEVFDTKNNKVGQILVFDKNRGFFMISNNNDLIVDSSKKGLNIDYYSIPNTLYYDGYSIKTKNNETLWAKDLVSYGSGLTEKFHRNTNETFFTEKKRYLLNDWDPAYQTFADTSTADFKGKITWSTTQELDWGCASYALAHLLWTYKINNVVDLTQNFVSAHALAQYFSVNYLHDQPVIGTLAVDVDNINPWLQGGYYIDFVDVSNGISDNLENAPIVGNYMADGGGHFALVTGKGRSVCGYFFGIKIYTSWDIVNTWGEYIPKRADINSLHGPQWKYWIDNQYIYFGWTLRDSSGNTVSL